MQAVLRQDGKFPVKKDLFTISEIIGARISLNFFRKVTGKVFMSVLVLFKFLITSKHSTDVTGLNTIEAAFSRTDRYVNSKNLRLHSTLKYAKIAPEILSSSAS